MVDATTRIQELTSLNDTQLQKLVSIISNAFSGGVTQSFYGLLGGNMSLQEELFSAIIRATFLEGKIYVVESGGDVVTVCLVFREPASLFGSDAQRALGFTDVYKKLDPMTQAWWDTEVICNIVYWLHALYLMIHHRPYKVFCTNGGIRKINYHARGMQTVSLPSSHRNGM
ncbi:hypothetical protein BC629DRAFT_1438266 [Irpex lacteus]|nr:hypothetical protein BC629DRAFT_1438266 [Irpex lacteus]